MTVNRDNVLRILRSLDGSRALRNLLVRELGYEGEGDTISSDDWPADVASALAEPPTLLASSARDGRFTVIHTRLSTSGRLSLITERKIIERLRQRYPFSLYVFSDAEDKLWHFVNAPHGAGETGAGSDGSPTRKQYRRIVVGPDERLRTATERLSMLSVDDLAEKSGKETDELSPLEVQAAHDAAFDVEPVTNEFFREYARVFSRVEGLVEGIADPERKRLFTQRLFNRLMFLAFIQKKGWLRFGDRQDYLPALFEAYREDEYDENFYRDRLKHLFFTGLNTPHELDIIGINEGGYLGEIIGDVPYLNGGLFEMDEDDRDEGVVVPDEAIALIFQDLFDQFNFTITESTPLDVEVAVDPEMLGRVFEELVTGRHETGSYYTPKPIVSFMCREALKGHLGAKLPQDSPEAVGQFVEEQDPSGLRDPEGALEALRSVRVCDPACGSGAYLLGMLHELLDLRTSLFATRSLDPISNYDRKLEIIQRNLYGVDIDPFAVNIARLRLWLSLVVEFEGEEGQKPPPLPNLDFKIEVGDSLTAPDPSGGSQTDLARGTDIEDFYRLKNEYLRAHGEEKKRLKAHIDEMRQTLSDWLHPGVEPEGFDWQVEFAEVFASSADRTGSAGGFEVILANPPYVRADAQFRHLAHKESVRQSVIAGYKAQRNRLKQSGTYQTLYQKWDLYIPFVERIYQMLRIGGQGVLIIPDAFNAAKYAKKLREFLLQESKVTRLDFCSDIPLFRAGVYNTILHFAREARFNDNRPVRVRRWGNSSQEFTQNAEILPTAPQGTFGEVLFRPDGVVGTTEVEGAVELGRLCYISAGMVINADEDEHIGEFGAEDLLVNERDESHSKRFILGKDFGRWRPRKVRYLEWGTERAPHHFRRATFPQLQEAKEKLVAMRTPGAEPQVLYDSEGLHFDASSVGFVPWHHLKGVMNKSISKSAKYKSQMPEGDREEREELSKRFDLKYLLAVMNSSFAQQWLSSRRSSNKHIYPDDWKPLPLVELPPSEQAEFARLVDAILVEFEQHEGILPRDVADYVSQIEAEIDERVAALYGL